MCRVANGLIFQPDAISIARSRLLEVSYFVRVTVGVGSLSSEVSVQLPIRVVNFISIDPIPPFAPPQVMLPLKRHTGSVETEKQRSRSMDDMRGIHLARTVFGSGVAAPGVGIIASDGTYRGDATLHPIGRLEIRNFTPPEVLMRRAAEQRLQEFVLDHGLGAEASEESGYPQEPATMKSGVADGGGMQDDSVEQECIAHARVSEVDGLVTHTPYFGGSSVEGSQDTQQVSPDFERGAVPLMAYSSTATQRMYNVSQETAPGRPLPKPSASAPTLQTSPSPGDTIGGDITSEEEVDIVLGSLNPGDRSDAGSMQDSGVEVDRGETPERQSNAQIFLQEEPLRRNPALSLDPFDVPSPVESISRSTSNRRPWQVGSQPLPTRIGQRSSVSTVASSMQSSRATSMISGADSRTSGSHSSHNSISDPRIGGSKPARGQPTWVASALPVRKYPTPDGGRPMSLNIGHPIKGVPAGLVLQPRPLPTSRTAARWSMVEGGPRTRTALGFKSPPPGPITRPNPQQARSSNRETASVSPSTEPKKSSRETSALENKTDSTETSSRDKPELGEHTALSAPQILHQPTPSEDPHFIPSTVSALMRTDIQPGNISTSIIRGPRPAPERQPTKQPKGEEPLEDVSRSAPPLLRKWENNSHSTYPQQQDTTPTPPSRTWLSTTSTTSTPSKPGPTSVKSRIAMLEEKAKTLDNMSGTAIGVRWSAPSGGTGVGSRQSGVRPLSISSAVAFENSSSISREP